jgi:RES domain-containing protein
VEGEDPAEAIQAWRLVKDRFAGSAFDGEGARRHGGRWNSPGTAVVYVAESRALATLEILAGIRSVSTLDAYVLIPVTFAPELVEVLRPEVLPGKWREHPAPRKTRALGDRWVREGRSAVLRVPSALIPQEFNFLLNPGHPDFPRVQIGEPVPFARDSRLRGD